MAYVVNLASSCLLSGAFEIFESTPPYSGSQLSGGFIFKRPQRMCLEWPALLQALWQQAAGPGWPRSSDGCYK